MMVEVYDHQCQLKRTKKQENPAIILSSPCETSSNGVHLRGGGGYSLIWAIWGRAAGQGTVFGLAVLNRVYNLTCLCPKQVKNLS